MNFISLEFIALFPVLLLLYWLLPGKIRWAFLLLTSYGFYFYWNPWVVVLLFGTTLISYFAAIKIDQSEEPKAKKKLLIITLVICFGVLFVFKYLGFFAWNIGALLQFLHITKADWIIEILLPVGISFYTFQTASYVIDVYRSKIKAERHFGYYALFVSFFPQLVAGPIERPENLLPQLHETKNFRISNQNLVYGMMQMARGYLKKVVVADYAAVYVDQIFSNTADAKGPVVIIGALLFAIQIYCDFSGYSDIAVGASRMLGIHLMENFNIPYTASSIREFWRRWHISLTSWFTDYVYIPLGGNRVSRMKLYRNIMIVFLLSGAWHGAAWTYIVWGAIHGVYLCVENKVYKAKLKKQSQLLRTGVTFLLVSFAWIFFRADTLSDAFILICNTARGWSIASIQSSIAWLNITFETGIRMALSIVALTLLDHVSFSKKRWNMNQDKACTLALLIMEMILIVGIGWLALLSQNVGSTFIYFQF